MDSPLDVIILAAGKGTRMHSQKSKVLHELGGKTLLQHSIDVARELKAGSIHVVVGHQAEQVRESVAREGINIVLQEEQLGTGHAVQQTLDHLEKDAAALVLYGDVPLLRPSTLTALLSSVNVNTMAVLTCRMPDPSGLGRIIRDEQGKVSAIVEEKDATEQQRSIREINTGIMVIPVAKLITWLPRLRSENAQGEYYLTDIVAMAVSEGCDVHALVCDDPLEVSGVNDRRQLARLERHYQQRLTDELMLSGVTLRDPARVDIRGDLLAGKDVTIDVNVILEGSVQLGENVEIGANCILKNCTIGSGTVIQPNTIIESSTIGSDCAIGPFARIRPGTELDTGAKIGNFVETKKARIGKGSKVNHLSYIGDSRLGSEVNVGAGTITCNYDGVNKHLTEIGNGVFIGSNSVLVAPVIIEDGAFVAAGSVITKSVNEKQLAIGRGRQTNIDGWKRPAKKDK